MKRLIGMAAALLASAAVQAAPVPGTVDKLWRLDCGRFNVNQPNIFSDTQAYTGQTRELVGSCYLIKDGDAYMLWDTGVPAALLGAKPDPTQAMLFTWMPVIFTFMLASFPAGLVIYWAWNSTLSVTQQSIIMKRHGVKIELFDNLKNLFRRKPAPSK